MYGASQCFAYAVDHTDAGTRRAAAGLRGTAFSASRDTGRSTQPTARLRRPHDPLDPVTPIRTRAAWSLTAANRPKGIGYGRFTSRVGPSRRTDNGIGKAIPARMNWTDTTSSIRCTTIWWPTRNTEKERVRQVVRDLTDHLIDHGFALVDHDGTPTRWGNYRPESLNHDIHWWPERGLNSLSMLSYLAVAHHVTGDDRYQEVGPSPDGTTCLPDERDWCPKCSEAWAPAINRTTRWPS